MLILTRNIGESLRIGDEVSVTVLGTKGGQVRIGVDAPKSVSVHREEIYRRIQQEQQGERAPRETAQPQSYAKKPRPAEHKSPSMPHQQRHSTPHGNSAPTGAWTGESDLSQTKPRKMPQIVIKKKRQLEISD